MARYYTPSGDRVDGRHKGKKYPSVTAVLDVISKPGLLLWYGKNGTEECKRILKESADKGTAVHEAVERELFGDSRGWTGIAEPYKDAALSAIEKLNLRKATKLETEVTVVNEVDGYAGTFDLLAHLPDKIVMVDWKSGNNLYPEYGVQLAAYARAWDLTKVGEVDDKNNAIAVEGLACVRLGPDGDFEINEYEYSEIEPMFEVFKAALTIFNWKAGKGD